MGTIEKALQIAAKAHEGQEDKQGKPYILHPLRVMAQVSHLTAATQIAAILHDVVEDTNVTLDDLEDAGFSSQVILVVQALTRAKGESYCDFIIRCSRNATARDVKLADLVDNSRIERAILNLNKLNEMSHRVRKYQLSYAFLKGHISVEQYRKAMEDCDEPQRT